MVLTWASCASSKSVKSGPGVALSLCTEGDKLNLETEFGVKYKRIALLLCQAKGDTKPANALKIVCPTLEGGREEHKQVQGVLGQTDVLLIGWWGGNWESASSTFWFQPLWEGGGLCACGQHTVKFSS